MRSRSDLQVTPGTSPSTGVSSSTGCFRAGPSGESDDLGRGWEVTIQVNLDAPHPVVSVAGVLGRSGGSLLTAVLEYVHDQDGRPVAVNLRGVSQVDRHGLASIIESGAVLAGMSPAVDWALAGVKRSSVVGKNLGWSVDTERLPDSGEPSYVTPGNRIVGLRLTSSEST